MGISKIRISDRNVHLLYFVLYSYILGIFKGTHYVYFKTICSEIVYYAMQYAIHIAFCLMCPIFL